MFSRSFTLTLLAVIASISFAGYLYWEFHGYQLWIVAAALPACLLEAAFYLAATFGNETRSWPPTLQPWQRAFGLWVSGMAPYLILSLASATFNVKSASLLAALAGAISFWYVVTSSFTQRWRWFSDAGFVVLAAVPIITRIFRQIYIAPSPHVSADILGHLMWIRLGIVSLLVLRPWEPGAFSLWPQWREWRSGFLHFAWSLPLLCLLALVLGDARYAPLHAPASVAVMVAAGTFFGFLWVVALSEELFFRGFLLRIMLDARWHPALAICTAAVLFGSVHLWMSTFPNWRRALVATTLGLACGIAYRQTRSVRAPMVAHALVITAWRLFFRG